MKIKRLADGKLFIQFKFNPNENLLSTGDEIAAAGPDGDDFALFMDAVIIIVDTEVRTIVLDPKIAEVAITTKKKLRKPKTKNVRFDEIRKIRLIEKKKKNAIFIETAGDEKDLIAFHKRQRKIKKILKEIVNILGPEKLVN